MIRIRQVTSLEMPRGRAILEDVQALLRKRLPGIEESEVAGLPQKFEDPMSHRFRALLFVADSPGQTKIRGFALLSHAPDLGFAYLDYIVTQSADTGGVGAALYQRVRDSALELEALGVFFECLPDEPEAVSDPALVRFNAARLRFYERFGARPIVGTGYETPLSPGGLDLPHLMFDDLGQDQPLRRDHARQIIQAILERKYPSLCSPDYVKKVVDSVVDDPVRIRSPRYRLSPPKLRPARSRLEDKILVCVNDRHQIHHVREKGYVETPARIKSILSGLIPKEMFMDIPPKRHSGILSRIHDKGLIDFLDRACAALPEGKSIYPYVFPIRNATRPPKDLTYAAGYYCIDTFTPLNRNSYLAARRAVDCALTAAEAVRDGQRFAYALVRPPGHHAERRVFGGFCYFNNAAAAAELLSDEGRVAILDIDYHHGNGQQDIFWSRKDVLTVSIHGHPSIAYPFFTGFEDEVGEGEGEGFNLNFPMPERLTWARYETVLNAALDRIREFAPDFLVVSLGFDTAKADPTGSWALLPADFESMGQRIASLDRPTVIVQEGGYRTVSLARNAQHFFSGLAGGQES